MSIEEIKEDPNAVPTSDNGKAEPGQPSSPPPTDFKIAEIWIKSGQLFIEAPHSFWMDKMRALGVLEYCRDIVKEAKIPVEKSKIIQPKGNIMNFVRSRFWKKK